MQAIVNKGAAVMGHDWHGAGATLCALDAEGENRLRAENAQLAARLRRLGPAMASMAADLAELRRELGKLERENVRLRALADERQVRAVLALSARAAQPPRGKRPGSTSSEPSRSRTSSRSVPWARSTRSKSSP